MNFLNDKIVSVSRLVLGTKTETYAPVGNIRCAILPVKAEDIMLVEGDPSSALKLVADLGTDIKEADKITDGTEIYIVKTIRQFSFKSLGRLEAFIYKANN